MEINRNLDHSIRDLEGLQQYSHVDHSFRKRRISFLIACTGRSSVTVHLKQYEVTSKTSILHEL